MKSILYLIAVLFTGTLSAQTLNNNERAVQIVDSAIDALGDFSEGLTLSGSGIIFNLGHYSSPEKTKEIPVREISAVFPDFQVAYSQLIIQNGDDEFSRELISKKDSLYSWSYYDETFSKSKSYEGLIEMSKSHPYWVLNLARKNAHSLRVLEDEGNCFVLIVTMPDGHGYNLFIDKERNLLEKIEQIVYNPIYGDAVFSTLYTEYKQVEGVFMPKKRVDYQFGFVEREIMYDSISFVSRPDTSTYFLKWLPEHFLQALLIEENKKEIFVFEKLSEKIDLIKYETQNHKSLLVKFPEGLALFEVPQGIRSNKQLIREIQAKYPNENIHYLFLTHHHPDHAGGIRAYADLPITVITTEGNKDYFNKLIRIPHYSSIEEMTDEIHLSFDNVPLDGQKDFGKIVTAYEIGKYTGHSDEHLVFYFPSEKFLWTGDLLFFSENERVYSGSMRAQGVYNLIKNNKLDVSKIYTSWPLHGQKEFGTVDFLKKLVEND